MVHKRRFYERRTFKGTWRRRCTQLRYHNRHDLLKKCNCLIISTRRRHNYTIILTSLSTIQGITPLDAFHMIEDCFANLEKIFYAPPTLLFKTLYYYYLSPINGVSAEEWVDNTSSSLPSE